MVVAMQYKERICVVVILFVMVIHVYVCWYIFLCVSTVSSPYLLVFGDDRVHGICEQVMMQVELVRLSCGARMFMGIFMFMFLSLYFNIWCKGSWPTWQNSLFCIYGLVGNTMKFYISRVLGNETLLLNEILNKCWCIISILFY